jgi:tRNA threonylcarbamoyladenosine biosynthesis protein TsaB
LAAQKPAVGLTTLSAYAAPLISEHGKHPIISAIDARHDHVYFQVVSGDGGALVCPCVAPIEEALDASRFGAPHLVGNAAQMLADRWPTSAPPPFSVDAQAAPDIAWVAWLGAAVDPDSAPPRPYYLRAPDAKPSQDLPRQDLSNQDLPNQDLPNQDSPLRPAQSAASS